LLQKEENWPVRQNVKERWDDPEIKDAKEKGMTSLTATNESCSAMKTCIIPERYYTFTKLIRVTAWCLRFSRNCKGNIHRGELDAKEIATAKQKWIKELQETLSQETNFKKRSESLGVFRDDKGILRCRGRIKRSTVAFESKFPVPYKESSYRNDYKRSS